MPAFKNMSSSNKYPASPFVRTSGTNVLRQGAVDKPLPPVPSLTQEHRIKRKPVRYSVDQNPSRNTQTSYFNSDDSSSERSVSLLQRQVKTRRRVVVHSPIQFNTADNKSSTSSPLRSRRTSFPSRPRRCTPVVIAFTPRKRLDDNLYEQDLSEPCFNESVTWAILSDFVSDTANCDMHEYCSKHNLSSACASCMPPRFSRLHIS